MINGIESVAHENNYQVIITQSQESYTNELIQIENLVSRAVDGLLVSLSSTTSDVDLLKETHEDGTPVVFFDRIWDSFATHKVVVDNAGGSYKMTKHLIESGYTNIAHITSSPELYITKERLEGYKKAIAEFNIPFNESLIKFCDHGGMLPDEVETSIDQLLKLKTNPDAIITASDRITISTIATLLKKNIVIPDQIAVGGFSNFSAPQIFSPALTTIRQPAFEMGKAAAELLIKLIESKKPVKEFEKRVLFTELTVRESTKAK